MKGTALCLATGQAFTSDYARRFRKDLPDEANACECGNPNRTWDHLVYGCRFNNARLEVCDFIYPLHLFLFLKPLIFRDST